MALFHSPKTSTDGLVFMYDTGNRKSYPGEPTTNYGPASFGDWGTESTAERIATGNTFNGQPTYNCRTVVGQSYRGIEKTISGLRTAAGSSGTVTMSCMVRNNNATAYNMFAYIGHDFGSTRSIAANSDWQKVQWTVNQSSMNNDYVEFRPYTNDANIYLEMTMPMVEVNKGHATQFVNGTRSNTQGLIDRTGNTTIDLSNVSFDSNAQITFDGTDDYIDLGDLELGGDPFTVEAVIYPKASSTYHVFFRKGDNSTSNTNMDWSMGYDYNQFHFRTQNASVSINEYAGANFVNNYGHVTLTYDGSTIRMYVNGSEVSNKTVTLANNYSNYSIGRGINNYAQLDVNTLKVYNQVLTSTEITKNFNAIRSRFGL
jgi:hypothetical protein